ncbi:MAG: class I SAM-dependent rRNA methyltransferase [Deltaproteobacteria bacterium]|nr:class I SAM-dependent rRNA methyltransferase [Deltaproteobacteria bacterium]
MEIAVIKKPSRILSGHLWVFSNELAQSPKRFEPGSLVELQDRFGEFMGIAYINPHSLIAARILSRRKEEINGGFFKKRILEALEYRKPFLTEGAGFRAVFSEGDLLPGLIVDKYADCLSVQFLTLGMDRFSDTIIKVLDEIFEPKVIVLRNDGSMRTLEGLLLEKKLVKGRLDSLPVIREGKAVFEVDPLGGQKTGFFLDQSENRLAFSGMATGKTGLDLFCHTGAWTIGMALNGCEAVTAVDSSDTALKQARKNAELNKVSERCSFVKDDVNRFVEGELSSERLYDCITLDPPAFVKSRASVSVGRRAYRKINGSCMRLLKKGGLLATSSCSYHIDREEFLEILRSAAKDAGRAFRLVEARAQAKDHPVNLSHPESGYLKCMILQCAG